MSIFGPNFGMDGFERVLMAFIYKKQKEFKSNIVIFTNTFNKQQLHIRGLWRHMQSSRT